MFIVFSGEFGSSSFVSHCKSYCLERVAFSFAEIIGRHWNFEADCCGLKKLVDTSGEFEGIDGKQQIESRRTEE